MADRETGNEAGAKELRHKAAEKQKNKSRVFLDPKSEYVLIYLENSGILFIHLNQLI